MSTETRMREPGVTLPAPQVLSAGAASWFPRVRVVGTTAYFCEHDPVDGGRVLVTGRVGAGPDLAAGVRAARRCALSMFACLRAELRSLDRVIGWLRVLTFVRCAADFTEQPAVLTGLSEQIPGVWGTAGGHVRSAVGVAELPFRDSRSGGGGSPDHGGSVSGEERACQLRGANKGGAV